ncbi:insulinase family protein [Pseudomonas aeruginosa]
MDRHAQHHPRSRACVLPNGLRLHLAHDPAASRAAAWLRVAAGSHDEPSAHPGLAHFLEHLSFLGGAAFPGDERLMPWLQVRGGQVNASTRGRTTDYFFEVTAEHLGAGLARLIDMLARPLLDIDAQRREREVLEAEYLARSADEQTLIDAALALGLPAGHPCGVSLPGAATAWPWRTMRSSGPCANSMPPTITPAIASYGCKGRRHWTSWRGWRSVPAPTCRGARQARVRRRRRCCPSPAKRWRCACRDRRGWCWALPSTLCGRPTNRPCRRSPNCSAIARRAGCWRHSANRAWANRRRCGWFIGTRGRRSWR